MSTAAPSDLRPLLAQVAGGGTLSESEAEAAFDIIMSGNATPSQMGALLMALRVRGETCRRDHRRGADHARQRR